MAFPMIFVHSADKSMQRIGPVRPEMFTGTHDTPINVDEDATTAIIVAPGAGHQIWVYALHLWASVGQQGTIQLIESGGAPLTGVITLSNAEGFVWPPGGDVAMPWLKLSTNQGLSITCTTIAADGVVVYAIVEE